jgi:hypothetical protein
MLEPFDLIVFLVEIDSDEGTNFGLPFADWTAVLFEAFVLAYARPN